MISFAATYYDGLTSTPRSVEVTLDEGDVLCITGLASPVSHSLATARFSARLGNTTRSLSFPDGSKCEVDDHAALDQLEQRTGKGRSGRLLHALESSGRWALAATASVLFVGFAGTTWGIPVLAQRVAHAVPPAMAHDLGRGTLEVLDRSMLAPSELPAPTEQRLRQAFRGMAEQYPDLPLTLHFRRGVGPNAFALPDGTVIATDELIELAKHDEEVLAVLAHEIGHVHHRHSLRMALEASTVVLLISTYLGDVSQLTTISTALPGIYAQASYSRDHETEADTFALEHLERSGISHGRFADIMRSLQKAVGPDPAHGLQYLASHPPTDERIQRFEKAKR